MEQILKKHSSSPPLRKWNLSIHLNHQKKKKRKAGRDHPWNMEPKEKEEDIGVEREGCEGGSSILLAERLVLDAGRHSGRRG